MNRPGVLLVSRVSPSGAWVVYRPTHEPFQRMRLGPGEQPVADTNPRMIHKGGLRLYLSDGEFEFLQFPDVDVTGHLPHADREIRALHLVGQRGLEFLARAFIAEDTDLVLRIVPRNKERKPL